ncbi:MAG: hypothetical protein HW421_10 [Ignavibacteria bacterium]|nr:hypothetical protein [Ignavibacteria bacterium]
MKKEKTLVKIKKLLKSKSFIGSIIFAISLWAYAGLNGRYVTFVSVPFKISLPNNKAIEIIPPEKISVKVRGTGWDLFNLIVLNTSAVCTIDLTKNPLMANEYNIDRNQILKGIQGFNNVEPIDVIPESVSLKTGNVIFKKLPIIANISVKPRDGFIQVGQVKLEPDSILIRGNEKLLQTIKSWKSEYLELSDINSSQNLLIGISDSLSGIVTVNPAKISFSVEIQQIAETVVNDVEIKMIGGPKLKNHILSPKYIRVTVRGGAAQIADFSPETINAYIRYNQLIDDTTGILIPVITSPKDITILSIEPPYIYHFKELPGNKLANLK